MSRRDGPSSKENSESPMLQKDLRRGSTDPVPSQRRSRLLASASSIVAHGAVVAALLWIHAGPSPARVERAALSVTFVNLTKPDPPGPPADDKLKAGAPQIAEVPTPPQLTKPTPAPTAIAPSIPDTSDLLSASQLAGAAGVDDDGAGGGGGGGDCDTARLVQRALRRDPLVRTAVQGANRIGKSVMLWNGDWVRSGEEEGKGLSAVREAIIWDLAFAPEACRNKREHGLILLSLADGTTRFAIGTSDWRWSDLLGLREARSGR